MKYRITANYPYLGSEGPQKRIHCQSHRKKFAGHRNQTCIFPNARLDVLLTAQTGSLMHDKRKLFLHSGIQEKLLLPIKSKIKTTKPKISPDLQSDHCLCCSLVREHISTTLQTRP